MWVEKHGKVYRIRDLIGGAKVTLATGYDTKTAAKKAMVTLRAEQLSGDGLAPRGGQVLLRDWIAIWQPAWEASLKPSSKKSEPSRIANHILPLLGDYALEDIDAMIIQAWVGKLTTGEPDPDRPGKWKRRPLSAKTVHNVHGLLFGIFGAACRPPRALLRYNPCAGTILPTRIHREMKFLTEPEIGRLLAALPAHWRPLVLLLVSTGLRWGEACALRVGRVDPLAKKPFLRVLEAVTELAGTAEIVYHEPKTKFSRRTVTYTRLVAEALAGLVAGREEGELLFRAPMGGPVRTRNFRRIWLKACAAAGLAGLRVHDLRHTHAAMLISASVTLTAVQRRLGHSSIVVTSDLYGHLMPEVDEGILRAVEDALAGITAEDLASELEAELTDELTVPA